MIGTPNSRDKAMSNYRQILVLDEKTCQKSILESISNKKLRLELMDK